jgi:hypothetical protein
MFHVLPKQMRYQTAPLPEGSFPRVSLIRPQVAFGTKRNRPAQCGTLVPTFPDTVAPPIRGRTEGADHMTVGGSHG